MNRADMRTNITIDLSTTVAGELSVVELDRAISEAVDELSRYIPREVVEEFRFVLDVTSEAFTSNHDAEVALANKPILYNSETVTNEAATTTYVKDTDYWLDYMNGRITALSTGSMANTTAHKITYQRDKRIIDISSELTNPIRIVAVETPAGETPQSEITAELFGDFLVLTTKGAGEHSPAQSQGSIADLQHIIIFYEAIHVDPTDTADGSFPRYLDELMVKGGAAYACRIEATEHVQAVKTNLTSMGTALGLSDDEKADIDTATSAANTALDKVSGIIDGIQGSATKPFELAKVALDAAAVLLVGSGDVETALDKVATHITESGTALTAAIAIIEPTSGSVKTALDKVDALMTTAGGDIDQGETEGALGATDLVNAATRIDEADTPVDEMSTLIGKIGTALDKVTTHATGTADSQDNELDEAILLVGAIGTTLDAMRGSGTDPIDEALEALKLIDSQDLLDANVAADKISNEIDAATDSMDDALDNVAGVVTSIGTDLTNAAAEIVSATRNADNYLDTGDAILNTIATGGPNAVIHYVQYAEAKVAMAVSYLRIATERVNLAGVRLQETEQRYNIVKARVSEVNIRNEMGVTRTQQAAGFLRHAEALVAESAQRFSHFNARILTAKGYRDIVLGFIEEAQGRADEVRMQGLEASTRIDMGRAFIASAQAEAALQREFVSGASVRNSLGNTFVAEGNARIQQALAYISESSRRIAMAEAFSVEGARRTEQATALIQEAQLRVAMIQALDSEAQARINESNGYIAEADTRLRLQRSFMLQAEGYRTVAIEQKELGVSWNEEADRRLGEFRHALRERTQTGTHGVSVSKRQWS